MRKLLFASAILLGLTLQSLALGQTTESSPDVKAIFTVLKKIRCIFTLKALKPIRFPLHIRRMDISFIMQRK